jgi:hypothetical protein
MRSGLYEEIGPQQFFYTLDAAVKRITTQRNLFKEHSDIKKPVR